MNQQRNQVKRAPKPIEESINGVFLVDKPRGITSHDVVGRMRRILREKRIGHAGTLDPMATGLLVVLVGEATKLEPYLAKVDKTYEATLTLGRSTDTFDAEGQTVAEGPIDRELLADEARIRAAFEVELARTEQIPPAHSAIHVDGVRSYELARKGVDVELAARAVRIRTLSAPVVDMEAGTIRLEMTVAKGYYVRSFARDVSTSLGTPLHLSALRRTACSALSIARATSLEEPQEAHLARAWSIPEALRESGVQLATADEETALRVRQGKPFLVDAEGAGPVGVLEQSGGLLAMAERRDDAFHVLRGFDPRARLGRQPSSVAPASPGT